MDKDLLMQLAWQPTAKLAQLRLRAKVIQTVRNFFAERDVLEVDTPALSHATVTDPYLHSMTACYTPAGAKQGQVLYLQTSPEYAMKRLLAAGSGPIYQICKAFRDGEVGHQHNPEFTMLEWYRPGFDHHALMNEMDELLQTVLHTLPAERYTYAELFEKYLQLNPHQAAIEDVVACAYQQGLSQVVGVAIDELDTWLQLLMSHCIEPHLGQQQPVFVYDFPASQAALARIQEGPPRIAERFEVYLRGIELANGYHELADAKEQYQRFTQDLKRREQLNYPQVPMDERLLSALAHGFPNCAGVALGIDRLVMLAAGVNNIEDIISFPIARA